MSLLTDIYRTHLLTLLGEKAIIEELAVDGDFIVFALPVDQTIDLQLGVHLTIYGINEGKLYCSLFEHDLERQLSDLPKLDRFKRLLAHETHQSPARSAEG
jgi:hypothetical protein